MKKLNNYSAQFELIQKPMNTNENHFHKNYPLPKKKLSKQIQEFINNVSASGFKQFNV